MRPDKNFKKEPRNSKESQDKIAKFWDRFKKYLGELKEYRDKQKKKFGENWEEEWKLTTPGIHAESDRSKAILWAEWNAASKQAKRSGFEKFFSSTDVYPPKLHELRDSEISMPKNPKRCTDKEINAAWDEDKTKQEEKIREYVNALFWKNPNDPAVIAAKQKKFQQMLEDARRRRAKKRDELSRKRLSWFTYHARRKGYHASAEDIRKAEEYEENRIRFAKWLEKQSGFDSCDLSGMDDELQLFVGCVLAAHEEASNLGKEMKSRGIRQRVEPISPEEIFSKDGRLSSVGMRFGIRAGARHLEYNTWRCGPGLRKGKFIPAHVAMGYHAFGESAFDRPWKLFNEAGIPPSFIAVLQNVLHENGHRFEANMIDKEVQGSLSREARRIIDNVPWSLLGTEESLFESFHSIKLKQYLLARAKRLAEEGELVTDGVFYEPGRERFSLSVYSNTKPSEFIAELYAKVMTTPSGAYLGPLGRAMRELINDDGRDFTMWLDKEIRRDDGKYYGKCINYLANYLDDNCELTFEKEVNDHFEDILKRHGYQGDASNRVGLSKVVKKRMKENYFDADTQDTADAAQKKLAHALNILDRLPNEKFCRWWNQLKELQRFGRYQHGKDKILNARAYSRVLDILIERYHDTSYTDSVALNKLLQTEIAAVKKDLKAAKEKAANKMGKACKREGKYITMLEQIEHNTAKTDKAHCEVPLHGFINKANNKA